MAAGIEQLAQHVALWSRIPTALIAVNPMDAAALAPSATAAVGVLNRYMGEMRLQEIGLLKALRIDPDRLQSHLAKDLPISGFFHTLIPRPPWMGIHPNVVLTLDDIHQFRMAMVGAKRRLNHWSKRPTQGRPGGLTEHLQWLQDFAGARTRLAGLAMQLGESAAGVEKFYDPKLRAHNRLLLMEESLKVYFQVQRAPRPSP